MGYNKIIRYGKTMETYEYENDLFRNRRIPKKKDDKQKETEIFIENDYSPDITLGKRKDNAYRASQNFKRIVCANLGDFENPLLVTLTHRDHIEDLSIAYRNFCSFIQSLRHKFGKDFKYISVPEFTKIGRVHFHALFWGLPKEVFAEERQKRTVALLWKQGYVFLKETDGSEKLSFYLSKYMTKAFLDSRLKNQKCYVTSRNIQRPIVECVAHVYSIVVAYGFDQPLVTREFPTKWLGKCMFSLYKIPNPNQKE